MLIYSTNKKIFINLTNIMQNEIQNTKSSFKASGNGNFEPPIISRSVNSFKSDPFLFNVTDVRRHLNIEQKKQNFEHLHKLHNEIQTKNEKIKELLYGQNDTLFRSPVICLKSAELVLKKGLSHIERNKEWTHKKQQNLNELKSEQELKMKPSKNNLKSVRTNQANEIDFCIKKTDKITLYLKPRLVTKTTSTFILKKIYRDRFDELAEKKGLEIVDMFA